MLPSLCSSIIPPKPFASRKGASRFTSSTRRNFAASTVSAAAIKLTPALFTSASTRPHRLRTPSTASRTTASSEISPNSSSASTPAALTLASVAVQACMSISSNPNPAPASTSAVLRPIPCAAPVTIAIFMPFRVLQVPYQPSEGGDRIFPPGFFKKLAVFPHHEATMNSPRFSSSESRFVHPILPKNAHFSRTLPKNTIEKIIVPPGIIDLPPGKR